MDNTQIYYVYLTTVVFRRSRTTYSLVIMWTEASSHWKRYAYCWHTKSNTQKISSCYEAIMSALALIEFMVSEWWHNVPYFNTRLINWKFPTKKTGFYDECKRRFNIKLWKTFTDCFNCLPIAAIIDEKIFCCHGGLSPDLQGMDQIRRISRPTDVPDTGLLCDLLWSDPDKDVQVCSG